MIYRICVNDEDIYGQDLNKSVLNPSLEIELNSAGSLNFTLPPEHENWTMPTVFADEVDVYENDEIIWFGRPLQVTRDWNNQKKVVCEGALAYFNDSVQRPKEYKLKNTTLRSFFEDIIATHNDQVGTDRKIYVGNFTVDDVPCYRKVDYETTAECLQRYCLDTDGGYFILRKVRDPEHPIFWKRYIDWVSDLEGRSDQPVQFGLNMLDIAQDLNGADICTVLIPTGGDNLLVNNVATKIENGCRHVQGEDEISFIGSLDPDNPEGVYKYGRVLKQKEWSDIYDKDQLFQKASEWLKEQNTDIPTIECSAADLHYLPEYAEQYGSDTGRLQVGQKVQIISSVHGIGSEYVLPMYKISMNLDSGVKRITIGTPPKRELTDIIAPTSGGSTRTSGKSGGGSGGGSGGSTYIPVVDVLTRRPGEVAFTSVVSKKKAKIDLSDLGGGDVSDVTVNGVSVVDPTTKVANVTVPAPPAVPVQDVQLDNQSVVDQNGIANFDSDDFGTKVQANPQGTPQAHLSTIGIDGSVYDIPGGGGAVTDVKVRNSSNQSTSVVDQNGVANLGTLATFVAPESTSYHGTSPYLAVSAYEKRAGLAYANPEAELNTVKDIAYTKFGNNNAHFDMAAYFQRALDWDDCFKIYPKRFDTEYRMAVGMNGNGNYPILGMEFTGDIGDYITGKSSQTTGSENPKINFIGKNGIRTNVRGAGSGGHSFDWKTPEIDVTLSYDDTFKPFYNVVFSDSVMQDEEAGTNTVTYAIEKTGTYAIIFLAQTLNDYSGTSIVIDGHNNSVYQNQYNTLSSLHIGSNYSYTCYYRCQIILGKFTAGTHVDFVWKHGDIPAYDPTQYPKIPFKDNCIRSVVKFDNMDFSGAQSLLNYAKHQGYDQDLHSANYAYNKAALTFEVCAEWGGYPISGDNIYSTASSSAIEDFFDDFESFFSGSSIWSKRFQFAYENSPAITSQKTLHVDHYYHGGSGSGGTDNIHCSFLFAFTLPVINYKIPEGYVTTGELNSAVATLQSNFQDGVDDIYDACISKGSTPASYSLADVVNGVLNIPQNPGGLPILYTLRMKIKSGIAKATTDILGRNAMYIPLREDGTCDLPFGTNPSSFKIAIKFKFDTLSAGSDSVSSVLCAPYNGNGYGLPYISVYKDNGRYKIWGGVGASSSGWDANGYLDYALSSNVWYIVHMNWNPGILSLKLYDEAGNLLANTFFTGSDSIYIDTTSILQFGGFLNVADHFNVNVSRGLSIDILKTFIDVDGKREFGATVGVEGGGVDISVSAIGGLLTEYNASVTVSATATITTTATEV